jgi:hypothetical protein
MTEDFKKIFGLLLCDEGLGSEEIHSGAYFVGVDNFRPDVQVVGNKFAGDSHFIQVSYVGAGLKF